MPLLLCLLLVLGVAARSAAGAPPRVRVSPAAAASEDPDAEARFELPVAGGQVTLDRLGIGPDEEGTALLLMARALHGVATSIAGGGMATTLGELAGLPAGAAAPAPDAPPAVVLAPFNASLWRRTLELDSGTDLFTAFVRDRSALLVAAAALQAPAGVRAWLARDPRLVRQLVRSWPGAFAQVAEALDLDAERVLVPGGTPMEEAWARLLGVPPERPTEFVRGLLSRDDGRLARFYAALARLDQARLTALVRPSPGQTVAAALADLYAAARRSEAPWPPNDHPFRLSYADLPSVLHALSDLPVDAVPAAAGHWPALLSTEIDSRAEAAALLAQPPAAQPFAATVLTMLDGPPRRRRDHMAVVSLARVLWQDDATPAAAADAVYALGHFTRYRALLLMLDRIEVRSPAIWARLVDAARRIDAGGSRAHGTRLASFQGALALVERTRLAGSLTTAEASATLAALADAVDGDTATPAAVRDWLVTDFIPRLPPLVRPDRLSGATAYESRVIQAAAGPPLEVAAPFAWEGLDYVVDVAAAEHQRILTIRTMLPSPGLDAALVSEDDTALPAALRAIAYAAALGDPEGSVTLSPDVVNRHDFGGARAVPGRAFAWAPAEERSGTGAPWHVAGSLLGLDLALARSALRRLSLDEMPAVPTINLNDQLTLARTAVAASSRRFDVATRDALVAALTRGRERVRAAGDDLPELLALAEEAAVPAATRQALAWTMARAPEAGARLFSLRDLVSLGRSTPATDRLPEWGVLSQPVDQRQVPRFDRPVPWHHLAGRPDMGLLATQVPDLLVRLAEITAERGIPPALIPALLLYATQDYWHDVEARFADDWPAMVRGAAALDTARVEDYVAALASAGPLRPR